MRALCAGTVIGSGAPGFSPGDPVTGWFGWQEYAVVAPSAVVRKIAETDLPLSTSLGILGINGATAHTALSIIGQQTQGETVVVSTAAGAVGSAAGPIATTHGCRPIGSPNRAPNPTPSPEQFRHEDAT